jgi:hypothetical protein
MKKKLIVIASVIILVLLIVFFAAGYFLGNVPVASKLLGTNKPKDLGVVISINNAYSGLQDMKCPLTPQGVEDVMKNPKSYTTVKTSLTSDEASSILALGDIPGFPLRMTQIKLGPNGSIQASGVINTEDLQKALKEGGASSETVDKVMGYVKSAKYLNFYADGNLSVKNNQISGHFNSAKIGNISIPGDLISSIEPGIASAVTNGLIKQGYNIRSLTISEGKVDLDMDRPLGSVQNWLKFVQYK